MTNIHPTNANKITTAANAARRRTNWRRQGMVLLATLTAITLIGQYVMLGTAGLGRQLADLPDWFFIAEKALWGLRGLVEIAVVVYVGMTSARDRWQAGALWFFKATLIAMIVATVGPVWIASTLGQSVPVTIGTTGVYAWGAALAGISAMMLAAVAYSYQVQPVDTGYLMLPLADFDDMVVTVEQAEIEKQQADARAGEAMASAGRAEIARDRAVAEVAAMRETVAVLRFLPASAQVHIVGLFANGRPDSEKLASAFQLSESTVRGVLAKLPSLPSSNK